MNTHSTDFDLNSTPVDLAVPRRQIRGRYLAHARLDARERAKLAADIVNGKAVNRWQLADDQADRRAVPDQ